MELPHGVLVKSFKGPMALAELNAAMLRDSFNGFIRASIFEGAFAEAVIVYSAGKPVIAFTSDGKADRPDNEQKAALAVASSEDTVIEIFSLNGGQLRLAMDFGRDYIIRQAAPAAPPVQKPAPEAPRPMPVQKPRKAPEKRLSMPEVRGMFVRAEDAASLRSYVEAPKDETGHAVLIRQDGTECHLLLLKGQVVAAYSAAEAGTVFLSGVIDDGGVLEFYHIDEALIQSILKMYPHVAAGLAEAPAPEPAKLVKPEPRPVPEPKPAAQEPKPMQVLRPDSRPYVPLGKPEPIARAEAAAHGTVARPPEQPRPMETHRLDSIPLQGVSAKVIFDRNERFNGDAMGTPAPESKSTGALKGDIDDDADFVKKVEKEFVGNVDDLLKRLELSHLKVLPEKKKRS
jgi:outer membrane biosynthesis protein TonB